MPRRRRESKRHAHDDSRRQDGAPVARDGNHLDDAAALAVARELLLDLDALARVVQVDGGLERRAAELEERLPRLAVPLFPEKPAGRLGTEKYLRADEDGGEAGAAVDGRRRTEVSEGGLPKTGVDDAGQRTTQA